MGWRCALRQCLIHFSTLFDVDELLLNDETGASADALKLDWRANHDSPVYVVLAAVAEPSCLVAATGHECVLHHVEDGTVLRRLAAGNGVLYALAINRAGNCLLAAGAESTVHVFNFPSGTKRAERSTYDAGKPESVASTRRR